MTVGVAVAAAAAGAVVAGALFAGADSTGAVLPGTETGTGAARFAAAVPGEPWIPLDAASPIEASGLVPRWRAAAPGIERAELAIGRPGAWRGRALVVRFDPALLDLRLRRAVRQGGTLGAWSLDSVGLGTVLAVNAGQFEGGRPWGWLVQDGIERQPPGRGPLSMALVVDEGGAAELVPWAEIPLVRFQRPVRWAFQSYPVLLVDGRPPEALLAPGLGVDLEHRDIRLALGSLPDGRLLLVLTRFAETAGLSLPWGPTVPETAALLKALGARAAVMLDGGLSAQMAVRGATGSMSSWRGGRRVPLALEATSSDAGSTALGVPTADGTPLPSEVPTSHGQGPPHPIASGSTRGTSGGDG